MGSGLDLNDNIPGIWYGIHEYDDEGANRALSLDNTGYACFDTTYYRHTFTLPSQRLVKVEACLFFEADSGNLWRNPCALINYGTGANDQIGCFGGCGAYHYSGGAGEYKYPGCSMKGFRLLAAGEHTIEIRARTWDSSTASTKFYNGAWEIQIKK